MSDTKDPWAEIFAASKQSREDTIKSMADALALVHALKQGMPAYPPPPVGSDLLFKLAGVQMDAAKKLAEISADHTKAVADAVKERRARAKSTCGPAVRVLVSSVISPGQAVNESFSIRNEASSKRGFPLPGVIRLDRIDGGDRDPASSADVFVGAVFSGDGVSSPPTCAQPFFVEVKAEDKSNVTLSIAWDPRLADGRYRGVVPLEAEGVPPAELIIELLVKAQ
jgi:hypothetical protein